jgi:MFS transporter, DHA2 family, multidrug resistance protein
MSRSSSAPAAGRGIITLCVMLATVMQALDSTIANVALPYMQGSMAASQEEINWVLTSYIVAAAIMTPPTGWLAGRFGRRRVLLVSVGGFTLASILCGLADSLTQIVAFRLMQGFFGAALVPLSQSVLFSTYPKERHGQAMAIWGLGVMLGPIIGPTLGGWLTETYSWRWVFYINVPIGLLALIGIRSFLAETPRDGSRFDWFGFALLSLAIGALQMLLDRGEQLDWFGSPEIVVEAVVAGLALYLFVAHILTAENPFFSPRLFTDSNFTGGLFFIFLIGIVLFTTLALLSPYMQQLMNYPVLTSGMMIAPRGIGTMLAMLLVGRLVGKVDTRLLIFFGLVLSAWALWEMTGWTPDVSQAMIVRTGIAQGFGLGFIFVPLSTATFSTLAPARIPEAAGLYNLMRNIGSSLGIAVAMSLLDRQGQINHAAIVADVTRTNRALDAPSIIAYWNPFTAAGRAALDAMIDRQAAIIAYIDDFKLLLIVTLVAMPLLLLLRRRAAPAAAPLHAAPE